MTRRGTVVLLAAMLIAAIAGSAFASGQGEGESADVTLRMGSYWTTDTRGAFIPGVIETYEAMNPGVTIEYSGASTHMDDLKRLFAVGDPPDMFGTTRTYYKELVAEDLLYDLTDVYAENNWLDRFAPIVRAWNEIDGRLYGVSGLIVPTVWHYNVDKFAQYDLDPPSTLAELLDVSAKMQAEGEEWVLVNAQLVNIFGAISCQTAGIEPVIAEDWTHPGLLEAARIFQQLVDSGTINPAITGLDLPATHPIWGAGDIAMFPMHTGITTALLNAAGDSFTTDLIFPGVKYVDDPIAMYSVSGGMIWAMPSDGEYTEEALDFFTYFMTPEVMDIVATQGEITPDVRANAENLTDPVRLKAARYLEDTSSDSMMFVDFVPSRIMDQMNSLLIQVVNGEIQAEEMMRRLGN